MPEITCMETRTGANPLLRCHGGSISFTNTLTNTMSKPPTSVRAKPPTTRSIGIYRWIRTTLFHVLTAGRRRGQEDDRELERRRRRYSHLCESPFYVACLYAYSPRGRRLVYSPPPSQHWSRYQSRTSSQVPRTSQHSTSQTCIKSSTIRMAPRSLFPPPFQIRPPHILHQHLPCGSTHFGFSVWSSVSHVRFWRRSSSNGRVGT